MFVIEPRIESDQTSWERTFVALSLLLGEPAEISPEVSVTIEPRLAAIWSTFSRGERAARASRIAAEVTLLLRDLRSTVIL